MNNEITRSDFRQLLLVLNEINHRLGDVAMTMQAIGILNSTIEDRQRAYSSLAHLALVQPGKYDNLEMIMEKDRKQAMY